MRHLSFPEDMIHSTTVSLPPQDVLARAKSFFAERVPNAAAFVEREGAQFVVLRGQGGCGGVRGEVPWRPGARRGHDARSARRRRERRVHRLARAAPASAMKPYRPPSRALTTFAVGFLVLDGLLLGYGGLSLHRPPLVVWGT